MCTVRERASRKADATTEPVELGVWSGFERTTCVRGTLEATDMEDSFAVVASRCLPYSVFADESSKDSSTVSKRIDIL